MKLRTVLTTFVLALAVLVSGCGGSHVSQSTTQGASATSPSASKPGFQLGPDPCRLVTPQAISATLKVHMTQVSRSKSSCTYMNAARTENVSISTAKTTPARAEAAVTNTGGSMKGKVEHAGGIGDSAIAYLTTSKRLSIATCLFAKKGTLVFLYVGGPHADGLTPGAIALAKTAASHA